MAKMKWWQTSAVVVAIVGNINWGLIGVTRLMDATKPGFNLVNKILGSYPTIENLVYIIVGLAGVYTLYWLIKGKK